MRKLLLAASVLVTACEPTSPKSVTVTATAAASSLRITEPVAITLTVTNASQADLQVTGFSCQKPFEVRDIRQAVVGPAAPQICTLELIAPLIIAPGASAQVVTSWAGDSGNLPTDGVTYVEPGFYLIRPRLVVDGVVVYGAAIGMVVKE